jgi:hypothetical protein
MRTRRWVVAGVCVVAGAAGVGAAFGAGQGGRVVGVAANEKFVFRVYADGSVEYLELGSTRTSAGIADWTRLSIDRGRRATNRP